MGDLDPNGGGLQEKLQALRSVATYPEPPSDVEAIETHFAWVFLVGERAYKLKKPVNVPGMDLRTLDARRLSCAEELRLNHRLAPGVYLDVVPLVRGADATLRLGGEGEVVDWLVRMRRLPAALMLDRAIAAGTVSSARLTVIGAMLAEFYRAQPRLAFEPDSYVERIIGQIQADRHALFAPELHLDDHCVQAAITATWCAASLLESELGQRAREGRILEAHGDLRPEHICLSDPPCIIDSLEFSKDLRTLDPAEELAFLWVECEQAGNLRAAATVLQSYRQASGDPVSERLLDFYRSRRATVRAKIIAWHLRDPAVMTVAPWREQAHAYLATAEHYARRVVGTDLCAGMEA